MATARELPGQVQVDVSERGETILTVAGEPIEATDDPFPRMDPRLEAIIGTLDDVIAAAEAEFAVVVREYNMKKESLKRLRNLRRAAGGVEVTQPAPEALKAAKKKKEWTPSEGLKKKVLEGLTEEPRIIREIAEATGVNMKSIAPTLALLRDEGRVRMVGQRKLKQGAPVNQYVITANGRA